jgi:opacity protein-like surface antigen
MPRNLAVAILFLFPVFAIAQNHAYLKYGLGFSYDNHIEHLSDDHTAQFTQSRYVTVGFLYEQYLGKYFSVETGIIDKYVETRIDFYDVDTTSLRIATNFFLFPLRIKARFSFLKKFSVSPHIGTSLLLSHSYNNYDDRLVAPWQQVTLDKKFPKTYFTFDAGAGLHYQIARSWKAMVEYSYSFNSKTIALVTMHNNENDANSSIHVKGGFGIFSVGIGYRISNIWIRDKKQSQ